jgi:hypothetical protein
MNSGSFSELKSFIAVAPTSSKTAEAAIKSYCRIFYNIDSDSDIDNGAAGKIIKPISASKCSSVFGISNVISDFLSLFESINM